MRLAERRGGPVGALAASCDASLDCRRAPASVAPGDPRRVRHRTGDYRTVSVAVGILPVLILLMWVKQLRNLGDDNVNDVLLTVAAAIVLGLAWGVLLRLILSRTRRRRSEWRSRAPVLWVAAPPLLARSGSEAGRPSRAAFRSHGFCLARVDARPSRA
jgi:hypothetical protein